MVVLAAWEEICPMSWGSTHIAYKWLKKGPNTFIPADNTGPFFSTGSAEHLTISWCDDTSLPRQLGCTQLCSSNNVIIRGQPRSAEIEGSKIFCSGNFNGRKDLIFVLSQLFSRKNDIDWSNVTSGVGLAGFSTQVRYLRVSNSIPFEFYSAGRDHEANVCLQEGDDGLEGRSHY